MELNSSFNKQVRKEISARAVINKKIIKLAVENPFDFTEYVENQEEENEIDLGIFLELAEENKIIYNQVPINTLIQDMEK